MQSSPTAAPRGTVVHEKPSRLQRVVAQRMSDAHATVPDFILNAEADVTALAADREARKRAAGDGAVPSVNDLVVWACARALRQHPRVNGSYQDGAFAIHERVNVGVVVATDDGVLVPTVFDADRKSVSEIAAQARDLSGRARRGQLTLDELDGGTFTVSNLGMFGITSFVPIVNAPQAAILGVGAAVPREGRSTMALTFVGDHRIVNGADGARFLADVRARLEAPEEIT